MKEQIKIQMIVVVRYSVTKVLWIDCGAGKMYRGCRPKAELGRLRFKGDRGGVK